MTTGPTNEHLHAGNRDFGARPRVRALCSCGYETQPHDDAQSALGALLNEHEAGESDAGLPADVRWTTPDVKPDPS